METKRPTNPAAEEILGGYFPVLDHGFVALVDYMGGDEDIERAARVSYGYGTRKVSATRGLIRYLRRHWHTTPSEMVELKFHCAMPMFVARQWIRHRTACLAEGTEVYFDLPGGIDRRGNQLYKLKVEEIWDRFQPTRNDQRPDKQGNPHFRRDRVRGMKLRQMNEETGALQHTRVVDVFRNGPKPVFRMTLADGKRITASADHRFRFADGWMRMWSTTPDAPGKEGHIVHWCDRDLPADFLLEFDVRIVSDHGLNIIFFCAKGRGGEDALDPALAERTGIFGHYTMGDLNCYHVSYFAHNPGRGGRATSNLRKNHGFYLVDNGPIGIPPDDHGVHHVALLKIGGTLQLAVDGRRIIDWHDDGRQYGPVWGEGKIALRQMKWTTAEYQNLKVFEVRA